MTRKLKVNLLAVLLLLPTLAGCWADSPNQIWTMYEMKLALIERYYPKLEGNYLRLIFFRDIKLNTTNGKFLTIAFIDSSFDNLNKDKKEEKAHEIAVFSASFLEDGTKLERLAVFFANDEVEYDVAKPLWFSFGNVPRGSFDIYPFDVQSLK